MRGLEARVLFPAPGRLDDPEETDRVVTPAPGPSRGRRPAAGARWHRGRSVVAVSPTGAAPRRESEGAWSALAPRVKVLGSCHVVAHSLAGRVLAEDRHAGEAGRGRHPLADVVGSSHQGIARGREPPEVGGLEVFPEDRGAEPVLSPSGLLPSARGTRSTPGSLALPPADGCSRNRPGTVRADLGPGRSGWSSPRPPGSEPSRRGPRRSMETLVRAAP